MVGLNPARFYGRLLPRPRIYCDVKFSDARVDPPASVNAAFLEWAGDASWKMGGTASKRKRMSGKIEGRMSKLRAMEESEEDAEAAPPVPKKKKKKNALGFSKKVEESPASVLRTPIERMLEPSPKRGKLAPRRIMSSPRARRSRKEELLSEESEDDSDDDEVSLEENKFTTPPRSVRKSARLQQGSHSDDGSEESLQVKDMSPPRSVRKSARLQGSPTASQTPDSKAKRMKTFLAPSPVPQKRKRVEDDSESDSDPGSEESDSVYL